MLCHLWRALFKGQEYIAIKKIQISGLKEVHRKIKNLTGEFPGIYLCWPLFGSRLSGTLRLSKGKFSFSGVRQ